MINVMKRNPIIFIFSILMLQKSLLQDNESVPDSKLEAETVFGRNTTEAHYLIVWETQCLAQVSEEVKKDSQIKDFEYNSQQNEVFQNVNQKEFPIFVEIFQNVKIEPFFEAITENKSLNPADINFKGVLIFAIVFISFCVVTLILLCVFTFSRLNKKKIKHRDCLIKLCLGVAMILLGVAVLIGTTNYFLVSPMAKMQKDLLCEATRIPHVLFFGSPEIYLDIQSPSSFVGFETIRKYVLNFLNESESFSSGTNYMLMKDLEAIDISSSVTSLFQITDKFFDTYEKKQIVNASGEPRTPLSIIIDLPQYKEHVLEMIDRYRVGADRLSSIFQISPILTGKSSSIDFLNKMNYSHGQLLRLQQHLSIFWNKILYSSFDGSMIFKIAVIAIVIQITILMLCKVLIFSTLFEPVWKSKPMKKTISRCLLILVMMVIILSIAGLFELARAVFSTMYGCSAMYQLNTNPEQTKAKVLGYFEKDELVHSILDKCYLGASKDPTANFYSIFEKQETRESLQLFLEFMDGIKMLHEEVQTMRNDYDTQFTESMVHKLKSLQVGEVTDFDDVSPALEKLNNYFECSETVYVLDANQCSFLPPAKSNCIDVKTGAYKSEVCVSHDSESQALFDKLRNHMKAEDELMEEMIYQLDGQNNPRSILALISKIFQEFETINTKVKSLDTKLDSHFDRMSDGPIETWLNCEVLQAEVAKSFNNLCDNKLEDMANFVNMNLAVIILCYFLVIIFFLMTFCLRDFGDEDPQVESADTREYQNMSGDLDNAKIDDSNLTKTDEDIEADQLIKPRFKGAPLKPDAVDF